MNDLRYALRQLLKNPGFTAVAVLTLALGMGANTAIFSVVNGVLLRPLPYPKPNQIVQVWQINAEGTRTRTSDPTFDEWREQSGTFQALAQFGEAFISVAGGNEPVRASLAIVSRGLFDVFGVTPLIGRGFVEEEQRDGGQPAVVVSYGFWQRYLGGETNLTQKRLIAEDHVVPVVGVMPPGFNFPSHTDLWVPRGLYPRLPSRTAHNWKVIGRLKEGVRLDQAQAEMSVIGRNQKKQYGDDIWLTDVAVVPLREQMVGPARLALLVLFGAVGFLLLVACANVVNLLLARASARRQELAVRVALGAGRLRLVRQFLIESMLLALIGGALGVWLSNLGVKMLLIHEPTNLPRTEEITVDLPVLFYSLSVSVVVALGLGLFCALRVTGRNLNLHDTLKESGGGQLSARSGQRVRGVLVVSEVALTLVLLVGAGLLGRSFFRLLDVNLGFGAHGVVVAELSPPAPKDDAAAARLGLFYGQLIERMRGVPGVQEVGGIKGFPLTGTLADGQFLVLQPGEKFSSLDDWKRVAENPERVGYAGFRVASGGYFRALGIPLLRGRMFEERDGPDAPHVALVSESLARQKWPNEDPLGKVIEFGNMDGDVRPFTLIGIVGDVRDDRIDAQAQPVVYGHFKQRTLALSNFSIVVRGALQPAAIISSTRSILRDIAPTVPVRFRTAEQIVGESVADRRFTVLLLGVFSVAALLLAVVGIYGVTAYAVSLRTKEIGIRMALGAQGKDVLRLVLGHGGRLILWGVLIGFLGALALTRVLRGLLFEIPATDPATFAGVSLLLVAVAVFACYVPARRTARVDPMEALRYE